MQNDVILMETKTMGFFVTRLISHMVLSIFNIWNECNTELKDLDVACCGLNRSVLDKYYCVWPLRSILLSRFLLLLIAALVLWFTFAFNAKLLGGFFEL